MPKNKKPRQKCGQAQSQAKNNNVLTEQIQIEVDRLNLKEAA